MAIWKHSNAAEAAFRDDIDLFTHICRFCETRLRSWDIEDLWQQADSHYLALHNKTTFEGDPSFAALYDLHSQPKVWRIDEAPRREIYVSAFVCPACGWWYIGKQVALNSPHQIWDLFFHAEGALCPLDLLDIRLPLDDVRRFLTAKYESRFSIHPRKFEDVVASVFRNLGYDATVTAYSRDGGVDVVLNGQNSARVGVQVKRYRNSIEVEQIRSFVGALMLGGFARGIFVTTSTYRPGAFALAQQAGVRCVPIELIDAAAFFDAMRITQIADSDLSADKPYMLKSEPPPVLHFIHELHRNSI